MQDRHRYIAFGAASFIKILPRKGRPGEATVRAELHPGQTRAHESEARFVLVLAGAQSGKTSYGPLWLWRETERRGAGDYLAASATYDLLKLKMLPECLRFFESLRWRYQAGDRVLESPDRTKRIILRSAEARGGLESATAQAVWLDEWGQDTVTVEAWEAVQRRLAIHRGRALITTTPYNIGWLKQQVYDRWVGGDPDYEVVSFRSIDNPVFPAEEYERAKATLPAWRFAMFYDGVFTRPAGLIYSDYEDSCAAFEPITGMPGPGNYVQGGNLVRAFSIPAHWVRDVGVDFGGSVNNAQIWIAEDPATCNLYMYREVCGIDNTGPEQARAALEYQEPVRYTAGGSHSEGDQRLSWAMAGFGVAEPLISDVEAGIDRVIGLFKTRRLFVFDTLTGLRSELGTYSRELDDAGEPLAKIRDKEKYHRCFVAGTLITLDRGQVPIEQVKVGDLALTRQGYRRVAAVKPTGVHPTVTLHTSAKVTLTGTGNHPVFVHEKGFVPLDSLRYCDTIEVSNIAEVIRWSERQSRSTGGSTADTQLLRAGETECITAENSGICTEQSTRMRTGRYQMAVSSIIKMVIHSTTLLIIWSASLPKTIAKNIGMMRLDKLQGNTRLVSDHWRQSGTVLRKVSGGIPNMARRLGLVGRQSSEFVSIAKSPMILAPIERPIGFVRRTAKQGGATVQGWTTKFASVRLVEKISSAISTKEQERVPCHVLGLSAGNEAEVFNLTVEGAHEYYANGILVHNCDATRYISTFYDLDRPEPHKEPEPVVDDRTDSGLRKLLASLTPVETDDYG